MYDDFHKPNWLLRGLIFLSVGVHLILLIQMTYLYRPRVISRIELTLKQISKPFQREIPRPRSPLKPLTEPKGLTVTEALDRPYTPLKPLQYVLPPPIESNRLMGNKQIPRIPHIEDTGIAKWQDEPESLSDSVSPSAEKPVAAERAYTDLVQRRIETVKQYPKRAQRRNEQGVVKIVFTIGNDGEIVSVNILTSSGSRLLDGAAIDAVKDASPFARPPNGSMIIQLPIKFELL
jgi:protein TonB